MDENERLEIARLAQALTGAHLDLLAVVAEILSRGDAKPNEMAAIQKALDGSARASQLVADFSGLYKKRD